MHLENRLGRIFGGLINKNVKEISALFNIDHSNKAKNHLSVLISKIMASYLSKKDLSNYILKVVNTDKKGLLKQSISFPYFKFMEFAYEKWESSMIYNTFSKKFIFFEFRGENIRNPIFKRVIFWKMDEITLYTDVKDTWSKVQKLIINGEVGKYIDNKGRIITNLPSISETKTIHFRPHGRNADDINPLPNVDKNTGKKNLPKYSFWLNKHFVQRSVLKDDK